MAKTQTQLVTETLQELNVLGAGQSPSSEDSNAVIDRIPGLYLSLAKRRVCEIPNHDELDETIFADLVIILAEIMAPKFGRARNDAAIEAAEDRIMRITRRANSNKRLTVEPMLRGGYRPGTYRF
jgi:hypothetical protein